MQLIRHSYLAVTDFEFYRSIVPQSFWKSFGYLAVWVTLLSLFTSAVALVRFLPILDRVTAWLVENLPPMEVTDGRLSATVPGPHRLSLQDPELRIVVDPADSVRQASTSSGIDVIFNSDSVYFRVNGREDTYAFSAGQSFQINRQTLESARTLVRTVFLPVGVLFAWPYYLAVKLLQAFFLTGCGLAFTAGRPAERLPWRQWLNVAIYSLTPAILIGMIFQLTTVSPTVAWFFYISTAMLYTLMAGRRCIAEAGRRNSGDAP